MNTVLAQGWRYFVAGLKTVFPWVLVAELTPTVVGLFIDVDLPGTIVLGCIQAFLYAMAICQLARIAGEPATDVVRMSYRAIPAVFLGYVLYEIVVGIGLVAAAAVFIVAFLSSGAFPALVACIVPLAPTAAVSTALAFFVYPAVLEKGGPFAAHGESWRLAMGGWAQATAVVSVPALVLAAVWLAENGASLVSGTQHALQQLSSLSSDMSLEQLQALMASSEESASTGAPAMRLAWSGLGAIAWWYTLAVCYAQYRALKAKAAGSASGH